MKDITEEMLTAYAVGELDAEQRAAVEKRLAGDAESRRLVAEIRATAALLETGLKSEAGAGLLAENKAAIDDELKAGRMANSAPLIVLPARKSFFFHPLVALAAAMLMVVAVVGGLMLAREPRMTAGKSARAGIAAKEADASKSHESSKNNVEDFTERTKNESSNIGKVNVFPLSEEQKSSTINAFKSPTSSSSVNFAFVDSPVNGPVGAGGGWGGGVGQGTVAGKGYFGGRGQGRQKPTKQLGGASKDKDGEITSKNQPGTFADPGRPEESLRAEETVASNEVYAALNDNPFKAVMQDPLSTFSVDVDTASYSNVRRFLTSNSLPPADAVRIEELVNYFPYNYAQPAGEDPFAVHLEVAQCPWDTEHRLVRVGIKGREIDESKRPPSNLVFLIDVSGSMNEANKLPLVQTALKLLLNKLNENDRVAIVVYAGNSGLVLPATTGDKKAVIQQAIDNLSAGGSTNGGAGIELAYKLAAENFIKGATNRVILATDGDWNVGVTNNGDLTKLIEEKAKTGVFLSVLGFGMGNYKDDMLEKLADKGNGNYAYIDNEKEAKKALVNQMCGTLITIAKDMKLQLEFNPVEVAGYRLIGYENRVLAHEDFNNDKKDAGDVGAGHTVTALYEVVPAGKKVDVTPVDGLKYQISSSTTDASYTGELLTLKLRYKQPDGQVSKLLEFSVKDNGTSYAKASAEYKFAAAVASFGMLLRQSPYKGNATFDSVLELAGEAVGADKEGYRAEFLDLARKAKSLKK
jgi:Ca-activated chloride channel family protein